VSHATHRTLKDAGEALMKFSSPGSHILYKSSTGEERCICLRYMDYFISASFFVAVVGKPAVGGGVV